MAGTNPPNKFPPLSQPDRQEDDFAVDLSRALARSLSRSDWSGIPDEASLGRALRRLLVSMASKPSPSQLHRNRLLVMGLINALEGTSTDGWALRIRGKQGPKKGHAEIDLEIEVGEFMAERVSIDGFESAVAAAIKNFRVKRTTVTNAYRKQRRESEAIERALDDALASARSEVGD